VHQPWQIEECTQHAEKGKLPFCKRPKTSLVGFLKKETRLEFDQIS
jgi:hypothetical protein